MTNQQIARLAANTLALIEKSRVASAKTDLAWKAYEAASKAANKIPWAKSYDRLENQAAKLLAPLGVTRRDAIVGFRAHGGRRVIEALQSTNPVQCLQILLLTQPLRRTVRS